MKDEIDLELLSISIIQLNTAFKKLNDNESDVFDLLNESYNNLNELYESLKHLLSQDEINDTEVEPFCTYGIHTFPEYKTQLANYDANDGNLNEIIVNLIDIFDKLYSLSDDYFKNRDVML